MTSKRLAPLALSALLGVALLGACGGDSGRPSVDEVSQGIRDADSTGSLTPEISDCIAEQFVNSSASDETLRALAEGDESYQPPAEEEEQLTEILLAAATECATTE